MFLYLFVFFRFLWNIHSDWNGRSWKIAGAVSQLVSLTSVEGVRSVTCWWTAYLGQKSHGAQLFILVAGRWWCVGTLEQMQVWAAEDPSHTSSTIIYYEYLWLHLHMNVSWLVGALSAPVFVLLASPESGVIWALIILKHMHSLFWFSATCLSIRDNKLSKVRLAHPKCHFFIFYVIYLVFTTIITVTGLLIPTNVSFLQEQKLAA